MLPVCLLWRHLVACCIVALAMTCSIRALMRFGEAPVRKHDLTSLRVLGSVGEPINPEAWRWYHDVVGQGEWTCMWAWMEMEMECIAVKAALLSPSRV